MSCLTSQNTASSGTLDRVDPVRPVRNVLVHLCGGTDWSRAQHRGELRPEPATGFVHLSTPEQVHLPANRLYRGHQDLLLLHVDPDQLESPLRWEPGTEHDPPGMVFPHLYGPLPVTAVIDVHVFRPRPDGTFDPVPGSAQSR